MAEKYYSLADVDFIGRSTADALLIAYAQTWLTGKQPISARISEQAWKDTLVDLIRTSQRGFRVELGDSSPRSGPCVIVWPWPGGPFRVRPDGQLDSGSMVIEAF